jgi:hypothetical protein
MNKAWQVKQFSSIIYFGPKSVFEPLFRFPQLFNILEMIKMSKNPHDLWKPMNLQNIKKLKRFLQAK